MQTVTPIHGYCDPRFSAVREAFQENFDSGFEAGASFAATIHGEYVVDLWAGHRDAAATKPWERDTIACVYSTTKVMTALCALVLADRKQLDLDSPVARYWPEFAQGGKSGILVRDILSHASGLSGFDRRLTPEALYDWEGIVTGLAGQAPWWEPGTQSGYHMTTFGYLVGELVRRITGKGIGSFFRDEVARPLGADFHIGLDEGADPRVAELIPPASVTYAPIDPQSIAGRTLFNPPIPPGYSSREWRAAEIPASNGHGNARSVARIGSVLACGGRVNGIRLLSSETIDRAIQEQHNNTDLVLRIPVRWGLGFGLAAGILPCLNPRVFYWGGMGGSWVEMDPDAGLCFSYVMNRLGFGLSRDTRMLVLRSAMLQAMERLS